VRNTTLLDLPYFITLILAKVLLALSILFPVIFIAFLFLSPTTRDVSFATKAGIGFFVFIILGLIFYVASSITLRKLSELSISIFLDRFERESGKYREIFLWKDVQRVEIREYPNGEIAFIKLALANQQAVTLFGFEDMATVTKQIEAAIPKEASIRRKIMKLNWDQPIIMVLSGLLTLAIILGIQEIGETAYRFFNAFIFFAFGLSILIFKPFSRTQGKGWRIFEVGSGVVLIVVAISNLALALLPK
jgi:hypothetical protein